MSGVPQGKALGTLLFNMYMSDLNKHGQTMLASFVNGTKIIKTFDKCFSTN